MSLKYRDHNGVSRIISGITPGGDLEYGAVATRSGTISVPALAAEAETSLILVSFSEPLPDADYLIYFRNSSTKTAIGTTQKTKTGFGVYVKNISATSEYAYSIDYTAYKLYDVADAEQLYSTVQDLEAMIPSSASSTNKFATADDLRTETRTLDRRLDDVEDVIPTSASITNKLVTQSDLSGVEIDKVEDINDVELTNIQDGQTLIWDDTNSKWVNGQGGKTYTAGDGITISNTDEISAKVDDTSITTDTNDALKVADTYKTIFVGTRAQWNALSTADKVKYNEAHITDDVIGGEVADEVSDGLMSPVTSNAVFDALKTRANVFSLTPKKGVTYDISVDNRYGVVGILLTRNNSGQAMYLLYAGFVATPTEGTEGGTLNLIDGAHITYTQSSSTEGTFVFFGYTNQTWHITEITS